MCKNVTCFLEPLTFEPIRSTIWNVAVNAWLRVPASSYIWVAALKRDNGFEKGPVPQLGWGRGYQQDNGFEKGPVPQLGWGEVSTGQRF